MATVTGLTAERMLEIEAASVVDGDVSVDGELILTKRDGSTINAGSVTGPAGPEGPMGSDLDVLTQQAILDIGIAGQIRAGRQLTLADFENIGLDAPIALWNFSNALTDSSGNGRTLAPKGTVPYARGIDGLEDGAVQFKGDNALYIADASALRPRVGSFGAWVRTAKQGVVQSILTKRRETTDLSYWLKITATNIANFGISDTGTTAGAFELDGLSKICDNRWHFIVGTYDGISQSIYVDGMLEARTLRGATNSDLIFGTTAPVNIGGQGADAGAAVTDGNYGRVDEAFITSEVLSEDKVYNLYCAKISHTLGEIPSGVSLNIYPGAKGSSLLSGDFPVAPLRLYNFSAGSEGDEGSNGVALGDTGGPVSVAGVDGTKGNAYNFNGSGMRYTATDAGLPSGVNTVSYGCWVKFSKATGTMYIINWGTTIGTDDTRIYIVDGKITFATANSTAVTGPFIADGAWHFVVVVHENTAADGLRRKYYLDGRLIASATTLNNIVLGGAGKFVIAASITSASHFLGQIDTVFVVGTALTLGDINKLYTKSLYDQNPSPKNPGDHIHAMSDADLLVTFDTLDIAHKVSMKVMA